MGNRIAWAFSGALLGFALLAMTSIGVFVLIAAVAMALPLAILRAPGSPWFLVGGGVTFAVAWLSLVLDPNAPDDSLWPVVAGLAIAITGGVLARGTTGRVTK